MPRTELSVNLNKIALIRNSRRTSIPDILHHADICINAGASGITVHPRPDQRHIRVDDVYQLSQHLTQKHPTIEFNIEGNPLAEPMAAPHSWVSDYPGFLPLVHKVKPHQCTLVPDSNQQLTSDHGFNLKKDGEMLAPIIKELSQLGIRVSLFMDPDIEQITLAKDIGAHRIELYTGPYADAFATGNYHDILQIYCDATACAVRLGLGINAGHDLNLDNLSALSALPQLNEVSIGHALVVDALTYGLSETVKKYCSLLE